MLEHTSEHPTNLVQLSFNVPSYMVNKVLATMHSYGLQEESEAMPWREAMPTDDSEWPQIALRGGRTKEGLTQQQLSELTGIPRAHISAMENGKRPIGKQIARKLADALHMDSRLFLKA